MSAPAANLPRAHGWRAALELGFRAGPARTLLAERRRHGPLAVQRPFYPEGDVCHVYLLHPPGGVVGGDHLAVDVRLGPGASALVTTPGATKFYRSAGDGACQVQRLVVGEGACLEWLPQENIFFPGAEATLRTDVELHGDARFALWEIQCLGRPAIAEGFDRGHLDGRLSITRDGRPVVMERLRVAADNRSRRSLLAGRSVAGSLLISGAAEDDLEASRGLLVADGADHAGATLLDDVLAVRYLGNSTANARRLFSAVWHALRPSVLGRAPCEPRIWAT